MTETAKENSTKSNFPETFWKHRRALAYISLIFGIAYAIACLFTDVKGFPIVSLSVVVYMFLALPILIYMTGANREDLTKIKGLIEVWKK
uniref:Uncharacterized protein n=1 Tax=Hydrogenovibrio crunogenus (strain DSM 25203 / XCL-2) TaxID=317025 RepID=Q31HV2_HYDCU